MSDKLMSDTPPQTEGGLLADFVSATLGVPLPSELAQKVRERLAEYPGGFAKARAYTLPDDIGPAFATLAPVVSRKDGAK